MSNNDIISSGTNCESESEYNLHQFCIIFISVSSSSEVHKATEKKMDDPTSITSLTCDINTGSYTIDLYNKSNSSFVNLIHYEGSNRIHIIYYLLL